MDKKQTFIFLISYSIFVIQYFTFNVVYLVTPYFGYSQSDRHPERSLPWGSLCGKGDCHATVNIPFSTKRH